MDTININDMLKLRRQQIVAQVMGGKKVPDLAREMGLTRQAIYKLLHAEGVYLRKKAAPVTTDMLVDNNDAI